MDAIRRSLAALVLVATLGAACTGGGKGVSSESQSITPTASSPAVSVSSVTPGTGVYVYQNAGLTATLRLGTGKGTLQVENRTGLDLPAPGFYLLDARDGRRVDGRVEGAAAMPDGKSETFRVSFSGLEIWNIGLAVLLVGPDNYGAFAPR